jgi:prepilin-type N-terminal cleavage/methylation domain-containing protein
MSTARVKAGGFTLIELIAVMIVLAIMGVFAAPQLLDLRADAANAQAADYGAKVAVASKTNYASGIARGGATTVTSCTLAVGLLGTAPTRLTFGVAGPVTSGQELACTVNDNLAPSPTTYTFQITGCANATCS